MNINLNTVINLRGMKEQAFKFAIGKKGGMKGCYTRGGEIFTPLFHALKNIDVQYELRYQQAFIGETKINQIPNFVK